MEEESDEPLPPSVTAESSILRERETGFRVQFRNAGFSLSINC